MEKQKVIRIIKKILSYILILVVGFVFGVFITPYLNDYVYGRRNIYYEKKYTQRDSTVVLIDGMDWHLYAKYDKWLKFCTPKGDTIQLLIYKK